MQLFKHLFPLTLFTHELVAMKVSQTFFIVLFLCSLGGCLSKPTATEGDLTTGRGIGSTVWGWLTYPFTWWQSEPELPPLSEKLKGPPTSAPDDIFEISTHNVTIFCNDQICTTMKCGHLGCRNITCNLYDTDFTGECREKDIMPIIDSILSSTILQPITNVISSTYSPKTSTLPVATTQKDNTPVYERLIELEVVLSSTVKDEKKPEGNKGIVEKQSTTHVPPSPTLPTQA